ncbi:MAG: 4Fe-4S binding protein [Bacillota bacterium]|nr:4Fe-4S binding protein [Bacillota bacterium]
MTKEIRKIVVIDEDKCNGCGLCIPSCAEGAMRIVDGKAKLITDKLCDGLGACLGSCPQDAITILEREADPFDMDAVEEHLKEFDPVANGAPKGSVMNQVHAHGGGTHSQGPNNHGQQKAAPPHGGGCPGSRAMAFNSPPAAAQGNKVAAGDVEISIKPQLGQWPVQLKLVNEAAPYFQEADLLITADCVPFAYPNYHLDLLKGKAVGIGCPKLDDNQFYVEKIARIIENNNLKSITVAYMEVPCCTGLVMAVEEAVKRAGSNLQVNKVEIGIRGQRK